ncbi:MAG: NAD(P)-dependent alcohol dehydrogenase [Bacteroidota bacterium]
MKAAVYHRYGSPENIMIEEVDKPHPKADEVLIKVYAASINSWDWDLLRGKPFIVRMIGGGVFKPKLKILGCDIAGVVEAVGANVRDFKVGDEVFGDISGCDWGGFAEYTCAKAKILARKPTGISFEEAAAIPQAGVLALQGLELKGSIEEGQRVLFNGAGGGVGTLGLQMAKNHGAHVTCVDRGGKLDMLKSLGAHEVIDYTKKDFTRLNQKFDLIVDVAAQHKARDYRKVLSDTGKVIFIGGNIPLLFRTVLAERLTTPYPKRQFFILPHTPNRDDLERLALQCDEGKLKPIIDQIHPLEKTSDALKYFGEGGVKGKAVISIR